MHHSCIPSLLSFLSSCALSPSLPPVIHASPPHSPSHPILPLFLPPHPLSLCTVVSVAYSLLQLLTPVQEQAPLSLLSIDFVHILDLIVHRFILRLFACILSPIYRRSGEISPSWNFRTSPTLKFRRIRTQGRVKERNQKRTEWEETLFSATRIEVHPFKCLCIAEMRP